MERNIVKIKRKSVIIELRSMIDDEGEKELHIVKQKGYYYKRKGIEVLTYQEDVEDNGVINNLITIADGKVNINRSGAFSVNQQFLLKRKSECLYQHPHGNIHMSISTQSITYDPLEKGKVGQLTIIYEAVLNGQIRRNHQLTLTFFEEDNK